MKTRILLLLFLCTLFITDDVNAKSGSSRGSSPRGSSSRGSSSRSPSHSSSGHRYGFGSTSSQSGYSNSYGRTAGSSSVGSSSGHVTGSSPYGHGTSSNGHTTGSSPGGHGTSLGQTSHRQNKDSSTNFLLAEGGGATRPAQTNSAPPSKPYGNTGTYPGSQVGKPGFTTENKQHSASYNPSALYNPSAPYNPSARHNPSAPPANPLSKSTVVPSQSHVPTSFGQPNNPSHGTTSNNPAWSNPHYNPSQSYPPASTSNVGFKDHLRPPIPMPVTSHPNSGSRPPYPISNSHTPFYPVHPGPNQHHSTFNPSYSAPSQTIGHPSSYPAHIPPPVPNTFGNPYSTHPVGGTYGSSGLGYYPQQHVLAQPAAQPYIPGQTVIMVPGQQDSGRGLGQMVKEALVFSTINAGVNRLINPHQHYTHDYSGPASSSSGAGETHITYNNNYFNGASAGNTPLVPALPNAPPPVSSYPANYPIPNNPAITPGVSIPTIAGNNANATYPGPSASTAGVANNMASPPVAPPNGSPANNATNQGTPDQNTTVYNPQYKISDGDLWTLTEELFAKQEVNISKYLTSHLQSKSENVTDAARGPLIYAQQEVYDYPTISAIRALYDSYEHNSTVKETRTPEKQKKEDILLDVFLHTNVMTRTMQWLSSRGFINPDDFEWKDTLRRIWFTQFDGATSGFERVFTSERYGMDLLGVQDWIYFNYQESKQRIDYMGYVDTLKLGENASLLKLNFKMDDITVSNRTIFVGTVPELEMSLYTICFYARPNDLCPISLGGTKFTIFTHSFRYYGKDLIDLALLIF